MFDLALTATPVDADTITVGYTCPCGCTPAVTVRRGDDAATEGCCCGNSFAVGADARSHISAAAGFAIETASVAAPWRERLPVVWAIGPSTHPESDQDEPSVDPVTAIDPVCGMTVDIAGALGRDLHATHLGSAYYFCGKGCKLDFIEDPRPYLAPGYVPSM